MLDANAMAAKLAEMKANKGKPKAPPKSKQPQASANKLPPGVPQLVKLGAASSAADRALLPQESPAQLPTPSQQLAELMPRSASKLAQRTSRLRVSSSVSNSQANLVMFVGGQPSTPQGACCCAYTQACLSCGSLVIAMFGCLPACMAAVVARELLQ